MSNSSDWNYDRHTKAATEALALQTDGNSFEASLSRSWLFNPSLNYYITTRGLKLEKTNKGGIKPDSDFIYALSTDTIPDGYEILEDCGDRTSLGLRREKLARD